MTRGGGERTEGRGRGRRGGEGEAGKARGRNVVWLVRETRELAAEVTRGPSVWDRPAWRGGVRVLSATRLLQYTVPFIQVVLLSVPEG